MVCYFLERAYFIRAYFHLKGMRIRSIIFSSPVYFKRIVEIISMSGLYQELSRNLPPFLTFVAHAYTMCIFDALNLNRAKKSTDNVPLPETSR